MGIFLQVCVMATVHTIMFNLILLHYRILSAMKSYCLCLLKVCLEVPEPASQAAGLLKQFDIISRRVCRSNAARITIWLYSCSVSCSILANGYKPWHSLEALEVAA